MAMLHVPVTGTGMEHIVKVTISFVINCYILLLQLIYEWAF
jgi:hypothetical protein